MDRRNVIKLLLTFFFLLLTSYALFPYISGWQWNIAIYHQVPTPLLVAGISILVICPAGVAWALSRDNPRRALYWSLPATGLLSSLVLLPPALGYVLKYGDPITHHGNARDIMATGAIPENLIYPALHLLTAAFSMVSKRPTSFTYPLVKVAVVTTFILLTAALARQVNLPAAPAVLIAPLALGTNLTPSAIAYSVFFLLGVFLLIKIAYRRQSAGGFRNWALVFVVVLAAVWITHVIVAGVLAVCLTLTILLRQIPANHQVLPRPEKDTHITLFTVVSGLFGFLWMTYTWLFKRAIFIPIHFLGLVGDLREANVSGETLTTVLFGEFGFSIFEVAWLGIRRFGDWGVILGFAGLGVLLWVVWIWTEEPQQVPAFVPLLIGGAMVWSAFELTIGIIPSISFIRALRPAIYLGPVLTALCTFIVFYYVRDKHRIAHTLVTGVVALVLVSGLLLGGLNAFKSPHTLDKNQYVMESDIEGVDWLYEMKSRDIGTINLWRSNDRYMDYLMRPSERVKRAEELNYSVETNEYRPPPRFGYSNHSTVGGAVGCHYYLEGIRGRATYLEVWDALREVERADFERLEADPTNNQIYSNGNTEVSQLGC